MTRSSLMPIAAMVISFAACSAPRTLVYDCIGAEREQLCQDIAALLTTNGFTVTLLNERVGIVNAESGANLLGVRDNWQFQIRSDTIRAQAFRSMRDGTRSYWDDGKPRSWSWYWNVRDAVQRLCGTQTVIVTEG